MNEFPPMRRNSAWILTCLRRASPKRWTRRAFPSNRRHFGVADDGRPVVGLPVPVEPLVRKLFSCSAGRVLTPVSPTFRRNNRGVTPRYKRLGRMREPRDEKNHVFFFYPHDGHDCVLTRLTVVSWRKKRSVGTLFTNFSYPRNICRNIYWTPPPPTMFNINFLCTQMNGQSDTKENFIKKTPLLHS